MRGSVGTKTCVVVLTDCCCWCCRRWLQATQNTGMVVIVINTSSSNGLSLVTDGGSLYKDGSLFSAVGTQSMVRATRRLCMCARVCVRVCSLRGVVAADCFPMRMSRLFLSVRPSSSAQAFTGLLRPRHPPHRRPVIAPQHITRCGVLCSHLRAASMGNKSF